MVRYYLLIFLFFSFVSAFSQTEICNDGIDNDNDGFIDCFDGNCANSPLCADFYIGKDKACQDPPEGSLLFQMKLTDRSDDRTTLTYGRFVVGDIDRDGEPEVVTTHRDDKKVFILKGSDFKIKKQWSTDYPIEYYDHAIANLDNDDCAEIFIVEEKNGFYITSYDCNGVRLWRTKAYGRPFDLGLADFDHDGKVELYYRNEILDAHTGTRLVKGSGNWNELDSGPVAADMLPDNYPGCNNCDGLELVLGGRIYAVDLNPRTEDGNTLELAVEINAQTDADYYPKYSSFGYVTSQTSIADYNLDGNLDVIMSGAYSSSSSSPVAVFFWDVINAKVKMYKPRQSNNDNTGWAHGTGRLNVADIDGDGKMNVMFVSGKRLFALKEDFTLKWYKPINEGTSGFTSTTVFDFNNDNAVEIVYRDEQKLYIIDGKTGNDFTSEVCRSRTANDYPVVVDVDGDGATEICVTCNTDDNADINNNGNTPYGQLRKFKSALEPWVSARKVWNQHGYFNVNVNDDLTIPKYQQKHHVIFSSNTCKDFNGDVITGANRALNSFLNQAPILDSKGCKTYAAADVRFVANPEYLNVEAPTCPEQDFKITFTIENNGDLALTGDLYVTFYNGDPRIAGASKLETIVVTLDDFGYQDQMTVTETITGTGGVFTLYAALNDNGSGLPSPVTLPNGGFSECDLANNVQLANVKPKPFALTTSSTPHIECGGVTAIPNGSTEAYRTVGGAKQTVGYSFYWFDGNQAGNKNDAAYVGSVRSGLNDGTYSVYALHNTFQCGSDTVSVTVAEDTKQLAAPSMVVLSDYTNCNVPDGALQVVPANNEPVGNFEYEWYLATEPLSGDLLSTTNKLDGFEAESYVVFITEKATGCQSQAPGKIEDKTNFGYTVTAIPADAGCDPANSGSATATVLDASLNPVAGGFTFSWYNGDQVKPSEDGTTRVYNALLAGDYTVVAKSNATGCKTAPYTVEVKSTELDPINVTVGDQTSCGASNGTATITTVPGLTYEWFKGNNTAAANSLGIATSKNNLSAGDYTIRATQAGTNCTITKVIQIVDNIKTPTITAVVNGSQTACSPANGVLNVANAGTAIGPFDYYWFDGDIGTPDTTAHNFKGQQYAGVEAGKYTVVAVDRLTRCASGRQVGTVIDSTTPITMPAASITPQTSCDPATPNGGASINVTNPAGTYTYKWYVGTDTTAVPFFIGSTMTGAEARGYTVKAMRNSSGCSNTRVVTVPNEQKKPILQLDSVSNAICDASKGFTGKVLVESITGPNEKVTDTYTFEFSPGSVIGASPSTGAVPANMVLGTSLNGGFYTATVFNERTLCTSDPEVIQVKNITVLPALSVSQSPSTNCDDGDDNGRMSVTVTNVASTETYDFVWRKGNDINDTAIPGSHTASTATTSRIFGQEGGQDYFVQVTNNDTGCEQTWVETLVDASAPPVVLLDSADNSICDATIAADFNGKVLIESITDVNDSTGTDTYHYTLTGVTPSVTGSNQSLSAGTVLSSTLDGGSYSVTIKNVRLGCESNPVSIQVKNKVVLPAISIAQTPSTNCDNGDDNGEMEATITNNTAGHAIQYQWYTGNTATSGQEIPVANGGNTNHVINLEGFGGGKEYLIEALNTVTGCKATLTEILLDESKVPVVNLDSLENVVCDINKQYTGKVIVKTITDPNKRVSDTYTFNFTSGTVIPLTGSVPSTLPGDIATQINGGTYTVTVMNDRLGCESNPTNIVVPNSTVNPAISIAQQPSTNCDAGADNGAMTASVTNNVAGHQMMFSWYAGSDTTNAAAKLGTAQGGNTNKAINLEGFGGGHKYTVRVYNNVTGCVATKTQTLLDESKVPVITLDSLPNSTCDPTLATADYSGEVSLQTLVDNNNPGTHSYSYTVTGTVGSTAGPVNGSNVMLSAGSVLATLRDSDIYSVTVTNEELGCTSNQVTIEVTDAIVRPDLSSVTTAATNCAPGKENGSIALTVDNAASAGTDGFTFNWRKGNSLADAPIPGAAPSLVASTLTTSTISGQEGGQNYFVQVINNKTGCTTDTVQIIRSESEVPTFDIAITDNVNCTAPYTGRARLSNVVDNNALPGHTYTVQWWDGNSNTGVADVTSTGILPANFATEADTTQLDARFYTAVITNENLGCVSAPVSREVLDSLTYPVINLDSVASTNCASGTPNGEIDGFVTNNANADQFTFQWYTGNAVIAGNTLGAAIEHITTNTNTIAGLTGGDTYTLEVMNETTRCRSSASMLVPDDSKIPVLNAFEISDNFNCTGDPNGSATVAVNAFTYRGNVISNTDAASTNYTFNWVGLVSPAVKSGNGFDATKLAAGSYTVSVTVITNPVNGNDDKCTSVAIPVTIVDDFTYPVIEIEKVNQTACNPTAVTANGKLTATVGGGTSGYSFRWFQGVGISAPGATEMFPTPSNVISNLLENDYTALVTNSTTGCASTETIFLPDSITIPVVTFDPASITDVTSCSTPNGQAQAVVTKISPAPNTNYSIFYVNTYSSAVSPASAPTNPAMVLASTMKEENLTTFPPTVGPLSTLKPGYVTAVVVDNYTSCVSSLATVQIDDATTKNAISIGTITSAANCGTSGSGGGQIETTVNPAPGTLSYNWYRGTPSNTDPIDFINEVPDMSSATFVVSSTTSPGLNFPVDHTTIVPGTGMNVNDFVGAGAYTLVVTDAATGCGAYKITSVPLASTPQLEIDSTDVLTCQAPFNGGIDVVLSSAANGPYDIEIFRGLSASPTKKVASTIDEGIAIAAGVGTFSYNPLDTLSNGRYLVRLIDNTNVVSIACPLDYDITINRAAFGPVVTLEDITPNTSCDTTATADGKVKISLDRNELDQRAGTLQFEITSATPVGSLHNFPSPLQVFSEGTTNQVLDYGFTPRTYMLRVTEPTSGCFTDQPVTIPNQPAIPSITQIDVANETYCFGPAGGDGTGSAQVVNVKTATETFAFDNYEFAWFNSPSLLPANAVHDGVGVNGAGGGDVLTGATANWWTAEGSGIGTKEYYVRATRLITPGALGAACKSQAVKVVIEDKHVAPIPVFTALPNTSCTPGIGEGAFLASVSNVASAPSSGGGLDYEYTLTSPVTASMADQNGAVITRVFEGLEEGPYSIETQNEISKCITESNVNILPTKFGINITDTALVHQLICDPYGAIEVKQITINRTLVDSTNLVYNASLNDEFNFEWFVTDPTTTPLQDDFSTPINGNILLAGTDPGEYSDMGAGTYYVVATRVDGPATDPVFGLGCPSTPLRVNLDDRHIKPVVTLTTFTNTSCATAPGDGEGEIRISVSDASPSSFGPFDDYAYTWTAVSNGEAITSSTGNNGDGVVGGLDRDVETGLVDGIYKIEIENNKTGCKTTETRTILKNTTPIFITKAETLAQMYCRPSGKIEVTELKYEHRGVVNTVSTALPGEIDDFEFTWKHGVDGVGDKGLVLDSASYDPLNGADPIFDAPGIGAGTYTVFATRTGVTTPGGAGKNCSSAPITVIIEDKRERPQIILTPFDNTSCVISNLEGEIKVNVADRSATKIPAIFANGAFVPVTHLYDYDWSTTTAPTLPTPNPATNQTGVNNLFNNLGTGTYNITVKNTVTNCQSTLSTTITPKTTPVFITDVDSIPQFLCFEDGVLEVMSLSYTDSAGVSQPGSLGDFTYEWYRNAPTTSPVLGFNAATKLDTTNYSGIGFGTYYVVAKRNTGPGIHTGAGCESAPFEIEITDERDVPQITLTPFDNTSCVASNVEGEIRVNITDPSSTKPQIGGTHNFNYAWTTSGSPAPAISNPYSGVNNMFMNLGTGTYSITVINNETGCSATTQTQIRQKQTPVFVTDVDMTPQYLCTEDGSLTMVSLTYTDSAGVSKNGQLSDFTYEWARGSYAPDSVVLAFNAATTLNSTNYVAIPTSPEIGRGKYYVVAKRNVTVGTGAGCVSAPFEVVITDERDFPHITLTPFTNTSCNPLLFEGEIEVDVTDPSASKPQVPGTHTYDYSWTAVDPVTLAMPTANLTVRNGLNNVFPDAIDALPGLRHGIYRLDVVNNITGCVSTAQTEIVENKTPVFVQTVDSDPQLYCEASGSLEVTQIRFNDRAGTVQTVSGAGLGDFRFEWYRNGIAAGDQLGNTAILLDSMSYAGIEADDDYYVVAIRNSGGPGNQCSSAPFRVVIEDKRELPVIDLISNPNTVCDANYLGSIITSIGETTTVAGPFDYNYTWTALSSGRAVPVVSNPMSSNESFTQLQDGIYQLSVVNNQTSCVSATATIEILNTLPSFEILSATKQDQTNCIPFDASITVAASDMSLPGTYSYSWTKDGIPVATPIPSNVLSGQSAGKYGVIAVKNGGAGSGCLTSEFFMEIKDLTENPVVELAATGNIACNPAMGTGSINMLIDGSTDETNYIVAWQNSNGNPVATLTNIREDVYSVSVTDNLAPNLGCVTVADITVPFDTTVLSLELASTPQVNCDPSQDGSVTLVKINETVRMTTTVHEVSTNAAHRANFDYQWFDHTITNVTPVLDGATATNPHILDNQFAGEYLVQVTNALGCVSYASAKIIEDETATPAVSLFSFQNPRVCTVEKFGEGKGELFVMVDGSNNFGDYNFEWFTPDVTGTPVGTQPFINDIDYSEPLTYTLRTTNKATNCFSLDTYTFHPDTLDIRVSASSLPITSCITDDGILFASVAEGVSAAYNYEWYEGNNATGPIYATTQEVLNASKGSYTVVARHPLQSFCVSVPKTVELIVDQRFPVVDVVQMNPLTYCYPDLFDGVAAASVEGTVIRHTFNWFEGTSTTSFYTGSEVSGLNALSYKVVAADNITGCEGTAQITIERSHPQIPKPEVSILAHQTNCLVNNGALQASVNGHLKDYIISWYNGGQVKSIADEQGEFYDSLDNGFYTTTAMEIVTGCVSDPVITEILEFLDYPEFHIVVNPTSCEDPIGEILLRQTNSVPVASVDWLYHPYDSAENMMSPFVSMDGNAAEGVTLGGLDKGWYKAQITTTEGCYMEKLIQVIPEILVFNAVSVNGDNANDRFEIACISDFPNNVVKIFNRAGTLVYEAAGYDNEGVVFTGVSNKGLSILGTVLPEGTYFFIIDKGDGSRPRTGYLELLR